MNGDRSGRRPGFSLIEATVAVVLLVVAMTTTVRGLSLIARDRQALERRAVAIREADNLLERLAIGIEAVPTLSTEARRALPGGEVEVERVVESDDEIAMERITVTVRYRDRLGMPTSPIRLSTWLAAPPEAPGGDEP